MPTVGGKRSIKIRPLFNRRVQRDFAVGTTYFFARLRNRYRLSVHNVSIFRYGVIAEIISEIFVERRAVSDFQVRRKPSAEGIIPIDDYFYVDKPEYRDKRRIASVIVGYFIAVKPLCGIVFDLPAYKRLVVDNRKRKFFAVCDTFVFRLAFDFENGVINLRRLTNIYDYRLGYDRVPDVFRIPADVVTLDRLRSRNTFEFFAVVYLYHNVFHTGLYERDAFPVFFDERRIQRNVFVDIPRCRIVDGQSVGGFP